ncbi:MAG: Trm112 family protein [Armatimonadetes bacterium]|nr:Trm112 family protein [Armatimonadota bacterium]
MDDQFLEFLANPNDPERPKLVRSYDYLICTKTGVGFPIIDGIPQLLPENEIPAEKMKELLPHE